MTKLQELQAWTDARVISHGLLELAVTPGTDAHDLEEMAGVALELLRGFDTGEDAFES